MDPAIIRPSQSLVKGGGPAAQFRLSDGVLFHYVARRPRRLSRRAHVAGNPLGCGRFLTQREAVQVVGGRSVP